MKIKKATVLSMRREGRLQNRALLYWNPPKRPQGLPPRLAAAATLWFSAEWRGHEQGLWHQRDKALTPGCVTLAKNLIRWSLCFLVSKRGIMNPATEGGQEGLMQWFGTQDPPVWGMAIHNGSLVWPRRIAQWDKQGSLWWPKGRVRKGVRNGFTLVGSFPANS